MKVKWFRSIVLIATVMVPVGSARAAFHLMAVDQVFFGTEDCPNAQYVMLRMLASEQRFVSGQRISTQNADGSAAPDFGAFSSTVSNGANGSSIIMGTAAAAGLFNLEMDQEVTGVIVTPNGRVCFSGSGDCVAYGAFTGTNTGGGDPAAAPTAGMALIRQSSTGQDSNDFVLAAPAPRNNAGNTGTLGVCPGGASTPTATVVGNTPTATVMPTGTVSACVGDCDHTDTVSINELVRGVNISLGVQPLNSCEAFDCQHNGMVGVNCLIQGVNNSLQGCPPL